MAAIFYIKDNGFSPLTSEQIDLFNRYKDQAEVWLKLSAKYPYSPRIYKDEPLKHPRIDPDQTPAKYEYLTNAEGDEYAKRFGSDVFNMVKSHPELKLEEEDRADFAQDVLLHAIKYFNPEGGMKFSTWLTHILLQQGTSLYNRFLRYKKETGGGEESLSEPQPLSDTESAELEQLIKTTEHVRVEHEVEYSIFRQRLQKELPERLFTLWVLMAEEGLSNPQIAAAFKLSPARISGLKKQMLDVIKQLPEIKELEETTSSIRQLIFKAGDRVRIITINKIGNITQNLENGVYDVQLEYNNNIVRTIKEDLEKFTSLYDSGQRIIDHYFKHAVRIPRCYVSLVSRENEEPQLVVLELRPSSEKIISARLYANNNLLGLVKLTEEDTESLFKLLRGYIEESARLCPPFTSIE